MAARLFDHPAAAMACLSGQGALLHGQHSCERIQPGGSLKLGRRELSGERNFSHARTRLKGRRGGSRMQVRAGLEELASNQVLVSAATASTLGQLIKPFAAALAGQGFNWKLVVKSGGMPSSHSAAVTAAATALGFERGFSDGVFGLSVILAGIVMYDAQGVRNAVGKQAKVINTMVVSYVPLPQAEEQVMPAPTPSPAAIGAELARDPIEAELAFMDNTTTSSSSAKKAPSSVATLQGGAPSASKSSGTSYSGTAGEMSNGSYTRSRRFFELAEQLPTMKVGEVDIQELGNQDGWRLLPLKESIGHTKVEVLVGGIWGVLITCLFHSLWYHS
ncbi:hypothetical protein M758_4G037500 [Ceratodon purpureus]|nr:hypothetical protein M758_4G037500 [Ceratodon purpureus]